MNLKQQALQRKKLAKQLSDNQLKPIVKHYESLEDTLYLHALPFQSKHIQTFYTKFSDKAYRTLKENMKPIKQYLSSTSHALLKKRSLTKLEGFYLEIDYLLTTHYQPYLHYDTLFKPYYQTLFTQTALDLKQLTSQKVPLSKLSYLPSMPYDGITYIEHLLTQKNAFLKHYTSLIQTNLIQQKPTFKKDIHKVVTSKINDINRTLRTEHNYLLNHMQHTLYTAYGFTKYQVICQHDKRTCKKCLEKDQMVYSLVNKKVGINYPPFHYRCRCTTYPL